MKKRKIVVIRGKTTGGKSTISYELAKVLPG
jgi:tRNA A37 N6-isopentenylltransferase MiaA